MSRVLIWSPNYAPELTGIPPLVTDAAEWLGARGHEVTVATAFPNYPSRRIAPEYRGLLRRTEQLGAVRVDRSWLRVRPRERFVDKALYEATFAAMSFLHVLRRFPSADVVVCVVPSFVASLLAGVLIGVSRRLGLRRRLVLWVQDLVFDAALSLSGPSAGSSPLLRIARLFEPASVRAADAVVVCSPGFVQHFRRLGVPHDRLVTVLNWVDTSWIRFTEPTPSDRLRVLYTGNIGYTQGFDTLAEAVALAADKVEVYVVGDGNAVDEVRRLTASVPRVEVRPPVPRTQYPELLGSAGAQLVIQRRVSAGANLPSKIASYLASGRPIIASIGMDTAAAELLRASGAAVLVEPEDPAALAEAFRRLAADAQLRRRLGTAGRAYAVRELGREAALTRLERVILQ